MSKEKIYTFKPNQCNCHPETCCCEDWMVCCDEAKMFSVSTEKYAKEWVDHLNSSKDQTNHD